MAANLSFQGSEVRCPEPKMPVDGLKDWSCGLLFPFHLLAFVLRPGFEVQFLFKDHLLDTDRRELSRARIPIAVEPQVFDLVVHLMKNRDRVVTKKELIAKIWHGRSVSESTLTSRINAARKAIGDSGASQVLIRTIARKGFRFVGAVQMRPASAPQAAVTAGQDNEPPNGLPLPDRPAIAVLPFTNMSGDREQDYFSDGISEDIITALSKLRWFFVIARNSSFVYKGRNVHINRIARELGVRYVVEGSVRRSGDQVRISRNSMTRRPVVISGRSAMIAASPTSSPSRMRSPRQSLPRSSRSSMPRKTSGHSRRPREAWTPGIS